MAAVSATKTKKAISTTATNAPAVDPLHSRCLQLFHKSESYSIQGCNVVGIYMGPPPCAASGGSRGCKAMVSNSQEPELRAPDQEAKRDLEHTSAILVSDKNRSDEPDQRAVFHPGLREAVRNKLLEHTKSK